MSLLLEIVVINQTKMFQHVFNRAGKSKIRILKL
jgi:hypothetical protein